MTTDGIHDAESEDFERDARLKALDDYLQNPTADSWEAASGTLGQHTETDALRVERDAYADALALLAGAEEGQQRDEARQGVEKHRAKIARLLAARRPITPTTWATIGKAPDRQWLATNWLPLGCVTILAAWGGAGKTLLALQLAAGVAAGGEGRAWIDGTGPEIPHLGNAVPTDGAPVLYASWEDSPHEFSRRLAQISGNAAPWVTPERLQQLHIADMVGRGPLWGPEYGKHVSTVAGLVPAGERLRETAERLDARFVVVDPSAAAFVGNENDRALVRAYLSDWDAWARKRGCGVLILAHQPKSGARTSGSTDWEAAARAVWTLEKKRLGPEPETTGIRKPKDNRPLEWQLACVKTNYGPEPPALLLRTDLENGVLRWYVDGPWETDGGEYDPGE